MNDLMIHVESIVRPIRATQSRKLRMRRELLTHLQAAYDEELARHPDSPLNRAKLRLGSPDSITAQLQQTVPLAERLLFLRLPTPRTYDRWESRFARHLWGDTLLYMTMANALLLITSALALPYAACLLLVLRAGHPSTYLASLHDHPEAALFYNLFFLIAIPSLYFSAVRFILAAAASSSPRRLFFPAAAIATILILTLLTCVLGLARRPLTLPDLLTAAITIPALLLSLFLTGRLFSTLQRPYQPWLTLPL
ncbi:MAG TPA: hypothetical protein VFE58_04995 [Tepidisphaeraceae bacterium]|jgi:hypothetical protein|nr:hypothetical protein [Tepidisphaeraceae bacterium]